MFVDKILVLNKSSTFILPNESIPRKEVPRVSDVLFFCVFIYSLLTETSHSIYS